MRIVVDTNIVFSAILNTSSLIGELLFNSEDQFDFYSSEFVEEELAKYSSKLRKATSMDDKQLNVSIRQVFKYINLISNEAISPNHWMEAYLLTMNIDEKDTPFIATTISINAKLWTGDKKLISGLRKKGFNDILNTQELFEKRN